MVVPKHSKTLRERLVSNLARLISRAAGPRRPPRVTDDDDGLAGAPVPKKPHPPVLSGAAAKALPEEEKGV